MFDVCYTTGLVNCNTVLGDAHAKIANAEILLPRAFISFIRTKRHSACICKNSSKNLNESHTGAVLDGGLEQQELGRHRVGTGQLHPEHLGEFLPQPLKGTCKQLCLMENSRQLCPGSAVRGLDLTSSGS